MKQAAENSTSRVIRRPERREIIAAVDPGSSWVRALIAEASSDGLELLGTGAARSQGISRGHVGSIPAVASTVARALGEAEAAAGREAHSLTVLLGGETIRGLNAAGSTKVESENGRVSARDIDRAMRRKR